MLRLLIVISFLIPIYSYASDDINYDRRDYLSRMGKVLSCNEAKNHLKLLDLYEAVAQYGLSLKIPRAANYMLGAQKVIDKLQKLHPKRHAYYSAMLNHVVKPGLRAVNEIELNGPQVDTAVIPKGCSQRTAVKLVFSMVSDNLGIKILVDNTILNKMSYENQVALIIHTIIGIEGSGYMVDDFVGSRLYVGLLLSSNVESMTEESFLDFLNEISYYSFLDTFFPIPGS